MVSSNSCLVQPAEATWNGIMPLTVFDQTGFLCPIPIVYFYRPSESLLAQKDTIFTTLRTSLSKILVHFYPLAGRLRWLEGARLELDCNAKGVQLVEAESDLELDDLGDFSPSPHFNQLIPQVDYNIPFEELPVAFVQLTKFKCGGIALCHSISHAVADGQSALHFISEWARLARGDSLDSLPFFDRKTLIQSGDDPLFKKPCSDLDPFYPPPPVLIDQSITEKQRDKETASSMLKLTKSQVEKLKIEANRTRPDHPDNKDRAFTRYEAITAHIWRCACRARRHVQEQPTGLGICIDIRSRIRPQLPQKYFGNAIMDVLATGYSGELVTRPLGYAASRVREAIGRVSSEFVHATLGYLKTLEDLTEWQDALDMKTDETPFYGNPNLGIISWMSLPLYGSDFGWGKEIFMSPGAHCSDGDSLILPGHDGDGSVVVALCLHLVFMEDFKKFFYEDI